MNSRASGHVAKALAGFLLAGLVVGAMADDPSFDSVQQAARASVDGQTYWMEQVASGLKYPSSLVWLPNGDMLIAEREGGLRILRNGVLDPKPLSDTPASFQGVFNGLKDIVLDPDYKTNHALYLLISEGTYDRHHAAVYRAGYRPVGSAGLQDVTRIFRAKDDIGGVGQSSARMLFLTDKTLLIAVPEDDKHKQMAQRLDVHIGKMLRINRDGSVPSDNPFLKTSNALPEIWSYGHRVPTGLFQDADTGEIWEVEPGPVGGDELNLLKAGANFGWAKWTWGFEYGGGLAGPMNGGPAIEQPILVWMPSATPSGLTRYRGATYPQWDGDFFVGHLSMKALERLRIVDGRVVLQERMLMDLKERIREVKVGPDNRLYVLTDHYNGRVLRLQAGHPGAEQLSRVAHKLEQETRSINIYADLAPGDPVKGKQAFLDRCAGCHSVGNIVQGGSIGPDLTGVYGSNAGSRAGFNYSAALAASPQIWNLISLNLFMADPALYAPGTSMAAPPLSDPEVRRQIVGFLKQESGK